jgi:hypothetical protein
MRSIRVGFFEDFKGADTLLIDIDRDGLLGLIAWLREVISSGRKAALSDCPGVTLQSTLRVDVFRSPDDIGLVRVAQGALVWQRSEDGWTDVVEKLAAMELGACHQYLDGPRDDVQVVASIGEYGDNWWRRQGG